MTEGRGQRAEGRGQKAEDRRQKTEDRKQMTRLRSSSYAAARRGQGAMKSEVGSRNAAFDKLRRDKVGTKKQPRW